MKRSKVSILGGALLAGALAVSIASPAAADFTPQPRDVVGGGSDTSQVALNYLADGVRLGSGYLVAGYNAANNARLVSFDATGSAQITLEIGSTPVTRPHNSGTGVNLLYNPDNPAADFARSSSAIGAGPITAGLVQLPFAVDSIAAARSAGTSNVPPSLSIQDLYDIYTGAKTNWNEFTGGGTGVIEPKIPYVGSGTRATFLTRLGASQTPALSADDVAALLAPSVTAVQEHDATPIAGNPNAVAPFSTGRAASEPTVAVVGGWLYERALYNVVRASQINPTHASYNPNLLNLFGTEGFACSSQGKEAIEAAGFQQLSIPEDGGVCGVATTAAVSAPFAVN